MASPRQLHLTLESATVLAFAVDAALDEIRRERRKGSLCAASAATAARAETILRGIAEALPKI